MREVNVNEKDLIGFETKINKEIEVFESKNMRHLIRVEVFATNGAYTFNYEGKSYVLRGDEQKLTKFLMTIKAKDNNTTPRSKRGERYADIAKEITNGTDRVIYVWSNDLRNIIDRIMGKKESVQKLFKESIQEADEEIKESIDDNLDLPKSLKISNKTSYLYTTYNIDQTGKILMSDGWKYINQWEDKNYGFGEAEYYKGNKIIKLSINFVGSGQRGTRIKDISTTSQFNKKNGIKESSMKNLYTDIESLVNAPNYNFEDAARTLAKYYNLDIETAKTYIAQYKGGLLH